MKEQPTSEIVMYSAGFVVAMGAGSLWHERGLDWAMPFVIIGGLMAVVPLSKWRARYS